MNPTSHDRFRTIEDVKSIVQRFERVDLSSQEWDHAAHLVVAAWYLSVLSEPDATDRMIKGICRLNHANGVRSTPTSGYHETLTMFWLAAVHVVLQQSATPQADLLARVHEVLHAYTNQRALPLEYYDKDELFSERARSTWLPPSKAPTADNDFLNRRLRATRSMTLANETIC